MNVFTFIGNQGKDPLSDLYTLPKTTKTTTIKPKLKDNGILDSNNIFDPSFFAPLSLPSPSPLISNSRLVTSQYLSRKKTPITRGN